MIFRMLGNNQETVLLITGTILAMATSFCSCSYQVYWVDEVTCLELLGKVTLEEMVELKLADHHDKTAYFRCILGQLVPFKCSAGTLFYPEENVCSDHEKYKKHRKGRTKTMHNENGNHKKPDTKDANEDFDDDETTEADTEEYAQDNEHTDVEQEEEKKNISKNTQEHDEDDDEQIYHNEDVEQEHTDVEQEEEKKNISKNTQEHDEDDDEQIYHNEDVEQEHTDVEQEDKTKNISRNTQEHDGDDEEQINDNEDEEDEEQIEDNDNEEDEDDKKYNWKNGAAQIVKSLLSKASSLVSIDKRGIDKDSDDDDLRITTTEVTMTDNDCTRKSKLKTKGKRKHLDHYASSDEP